MSTNKLAALVMELAEAVDNAAHDIGGSRPQLDILREAVQEATSQQAPQPQPVAVREPLTEEQIELLWEQHGRYWPLTDTTLISPQIFARAVERAHGIGTRKDSE